MNTIAILVTLAAWGSLWLPLGGALRFLLFMVFLLLGALFTVAGGINWWWDSGMRPKSADPTLMICGLLTLASRAGTLLKAWLESEGGQPWPETRPPRRRR